MIAASGPASKFYWILPLHVLAPGPAWPAWIALWNASNVPYAGPMLVIFGAPTMWIVSLMPWE